MKALFIIVLLAGASYWVYTETQRQKELQASLDQTSHQLEETQKELQTLTAKKSAPTNADWMSQPNPLNAAPHKK
jgi:hypothetical protein